MQEKVKMKLLKEFVFVTLFGSFAFTLYARAHESSNGGCELKTRCLVYVHRILRKIRQFLDAALEVEVIIRLKAKTLIPCNLT